MARHPIGEKEISNRAFFRTASFGESGERATPLIKDEEQAVQQNGTNGDQQQPVKGPGYAGIEDVSQAGNLEKEHERVNELYEE